jgi:hypothetical protein
MTRPEQRARTGLAPYEEDGDDDELNYEPDEVSARRDPSFHRAVAANTLKSTFESIFEKYGKDFDGLGDVVDLRTMEVIEDNGHLQMMRNEKDTGEGEEGEQDENRRLGAQRTEVDDESAEEERILGGRSLDMSRPLPSSLSRIKTRTSRPEDPRRLSKLGSARDLTVSQNPFSFGSWGHGEVADPAWSVPDIERPSKIAPWAAKLFGQRYDLPVRRGNESIWAPGRDTELDRAHIPKRSNSTAVVRHGQKNARVSAEEHTLSSLIASGPMDEHDSALPAVEANLDQDEFSPNERKSRGPLPAARKERRSPAATTTDSSPTQGWSPPESPTETSLVEYRNGSRPRRRLRKQLVAPKVRKLSHLVSPPSENDPNCRRSGRVRRKPEFLNNPLSWLELAPSNKPTFYIDLPARPLICSSDKDVLDFRCVEEIEDDALETTEGPVEDFGHALPSPPLPEEHEVELSTEGSTRFLDRLIPDSEGMGSDSSWAPAEVQTELPKPVLRQSFYRNEVDPLYEFSDDDEAILRPRLARKEQATEVLDHPAPPTSSKPVEFSEAQVRSNRKRQRTLDGERIQHYNGGPEPQPPEEAGAEPPATLSRLGQQESGRSKGSKNRPKGLTQWKQGAMKTLPCGTARKVAPKATPPSSTPPQNSPSAPTQEQNEPCPADSDDEPLFPKRRSLRSKDTSASKPGPYGASWAASEGSSSKHRRSRSSAKTQSTKPQSSEKIQGATTLQGPEEELVGPSARLTLRNRRSVRFKDDILPAELPSSPPITLSKARAELEKSNSAMILPVIAAVSPIELSTTKTATAKGPSTPQSRTKHKHAHDSHSKDARDSASSRRSILSLISDDEDDELTLDIGLTPKKQRGAKRYSIGSRPSSSVRKGLYKPALAAVEAGKLRTPETPHGLGLGVGAGAVSPAGSLLETPGGSMRRCGEDGFKCDRDFCFSCL